jgi:hypothetical protein
VVRGSVEAGSNLEVSVRLHNQLFFQENGGKELTVSDHCIWVTELASAFTSKFHEQLHQTCETDLDQFGLETQHKLDLQQVYSPDLELQLLSPLLDPP